MFRHLAIKKVLATAYFPTNRSAVSSALEGLTSEFGMESGVPPPPWSPGQKLVQTLMRFSSLESAYPSPTSWMDFLP